MITFNTRDIAIRHVRIIARLGEKSEAGELIGDLVRSNVRHCLIEMQAAGAETGDIRRILDELLVEASAYLEEDKIKYRRTLEEARKHMEFLLYLEERYDQIERENSSAP